MAQRPVARELTGQTRIVIGQPDLDLVKLTSLVRAQRHEPTPSPATVAGTEAGDAGMCEARSGDGHTGAEVPAGMANLSPATVFVQPTAAGWGIAVSSSASRPGTVSGDIRGWVSPITFEAR